MNILMQKITFEKNPNTKTTYLEVENTFETISEENYNKITNDTTLKWFRRLGGSETSFKNYTCEGYLTTKLISTSPTKQTKIIRTFKFN